MGARPPLVPAVSRRMSLPNLAGYTDARSADVRGARGPGAAPIVVPIRGEAATLLKYIGKGRVERRARGRRGVQGVSRRSDGTGGIADTGTEDTAYVGDSHFLFLRVLGRA